ncbi:hypothetical protein N7495_004074 [Penicillium taxi]|uniref:uncharacterized protein n=1 Tax=Penicillium taxi TaxID=168475 RepID=UPI002544ED42|nr:uncharacterized protein N7495_004074 [Penicillium taxi]KAJ5899330.1 hypothetical protein N7495_004074 [Penicillium taxi]
MSDPSSRPSIPHWQQRSGTIQTDKPSLSPAPSSSDDAPASTSRQEIIDQASRFLEDESIRDAPTDRKILFLESKGLNPDEIQQLLGVSRNPDASSSSSAVIEKGKETTLDPPSENSEDSCSSPLTASTTMSQPRSTTPSASRNVPPIITYPEFLFESTKPPPLVTIRSMLYTLYGAAGLGTTIYGASEYLVKPMLASLTSARHELATTAQENLQKLNEKLEHSVSVIPAHLTARKVTVDENVDEDGASVTSDPTELFHRDIGTQTIVEDAQSLNSSTSLDTKENPADVPTIAVSNHMKRLESIQSHLKQVKVIEQESSTLDDSMRTSLNELHHYLDSLVYATAPGYSSVTVAYGASSNSGSNASATGLRKKEHDAIAGFKAEIRGVKGALLSARNFPSSKSGKVPAGTW